MGRSFVPDLEMAMDIRERWIGNSIMIAIVDLEEAFATESGIGPKIMTSE